MISVKKYPELNYDTGLISMNQVSLSKLISAPQLRFPRKTYTTIRAEELPQRKLIVSRKKTPILIQVCPIS